MKIDLGELKSIKDRVTSVIFKKDEYTIEGVIRWMLDRKFSYDNFSETNKYYVFKQPNPLNYSDFEYREIEGHNIAIELGVSKGNRGQVKKSIDELIEL